jgi:hypothetical protein
MDVRAGEAVGPTGSLRSRYDGRVLRFANENKRKAGAENVKFLKGEIEHIPLPDNSVTGLSRIA